MAVLLALTSITLDRLWLFSLCATGSHWFLERVTCREREGHRGERPVAYYQDPFQIFIVNILTFLTLSGSPSDHPKRGLRCL